LTRPEASSTTKGARRCTNPDCEFGGRWIVGGMRRLKNGKFSCIGKGCHTVYEAREVIDPANDDDWRLWVGG
jgi:hypothetical protein